MVNLICDIHGHRFLSMDDQLCKLLKDYQIVEKSDFR